MSGGATSDLNSHAQRLLESWERLGRGHVMVGSSCSCGVGGVVLALADYEQDIADYLVAEAGRQVRPDVLSYLDAHGRQGRLWTLSGLLLALGRADEAVDPSVAMFILERLERTLQSFETLHGGG